MTIQELQSISEAIATQAERKLAVRGFDADVRWGNSALEGYGVNSPAMMEARAAFALADEVKR